MICTLTFNSIFDKMIYFEDYKVLFFVIYVENAQLGKKCVEECFENEIKKTEQKNTTNKKVQEECNHIGGTL